MVNIERTFLVELMLGSSHCIPKSPLRIETGRNRWHSYYKKLANINWIDEINDLGVCRVWSFRRAFDLRLWTQQNGLAAFEWPPDDPSSLNPTLALSMGLFWVIFGTRSTFLHGPCKLQEKRSEVSQHICLLTWVRPSRVTYIPLKTNQVSVCVLWWHDLKLSR